MGLRAILSFPTAVPEWVDAVVDLRRRQHLRRLRSRTVGDGVIIALADGNSHAGRGASGELAAGRELRVAVRHRMLLGIRFGIGVGIEERLGLGARRVGVDRSRHPCGGGVYRRS